MLGSIPFRVNQKKNGGVLHSDPLPLPGLTAFGSLVSSCFGAFLPIGTWPTPSLGHTETQLELSRGFRCSVRSWPSGTCLLVGFTHVSCYHLESGTYITVYHFF